MKVGQANPATSARSEVISHRQSKPEAAMAGSFSRKMPSVSRFACGEQEQVKVSFSSASPGKQTWKGAANGYTTRSIPSYQASPAQNSGVEAKKTASQQVKGKDGKSRAEAKSVAGKSSRS